ncbi:hypothetical protein Q3G72_025904 [Acer saccharum]|nr:hypothetical protein Q3G72_025904 [Acer saccharum]
MLYMESKSSTPSTPSRRSSRPPFCQLPIVSSIVPPPSASRRHRSWFRVGFLARIACSISDHRSRSHLAVTDPGSCGLSSHLRPPPSFASHRRGFSCANRLLDSLHDAGLRSGVRLQVLDVSDRPTGLLRSYPKEPAPASAPPPWSI